MADLILLDRKDVALDHLDPRTLKPLAVDRYDLFILRRQVLLDDRLVDLGAVRDDRVDLPVYKVPVQYADVVADAGYRRDGRTGQCT